MPAPRSGVTLSQAPPRVVEAVAVHSSVLPPPFEIARDCTAGFCPGTAVNRKPPPPGTSAVEVISRIGRAARVKVTVIVKGEPARVAAVTTMVPRYVAGVRPVRLTVTPTVASPAPLVCERRSQSPPDVVRAWAVQLNGPPALFTSESNFFDDEELMLLTELAGNVSFALELMQKGEALAESAPGRLVDVFPPQKLRQAEILEGDPRDVAAAVLRKIREAL